MFPKFPIAAEEDSDMIGPPYWHYQWYGIRWQTSPYPKQLLSNSTNRPATVLDNSSFGRASESPMCRESFSPMFCRALQKETQDFLGTNAISCLQVHQAHVLLKLTRFHIAVNTPAEAIFPWRGSKNAPGTYPRHPQASQMKGIHW